MERPRAETLELFVPGRLCLFGEHSDWAGGYRTSNPALVPGQAILTGTQQGIRAGVQRHPDHLVLHAPALDGLPRETHTIPMDRDRLRTEAEGAGFASYVAGVAYQFLQRYPVEGLVIDNRAMDLPLRKGLSSSAAACVLAARGFNQLYGLGLSVREEMELAYVGERTTPSRCGRLDQACAFGRRPVQMTFDGDHVTVEEIRPRHPLHLVIVDLGAQKDTRAILRALNACYPTARDPRAQAVQVYLGPLNGRVVAEARTALEAGDALRVGELMTRAQAAFDELVAPACPEQLTAPVLHRVLAFAPIQPLVLGGKGVGSQGDGAAQLVVRDRDAQEHVIALVGRELGMHGLALTIPASVPAATDGAPTRVDP